ncbi:dTDP-4-dehydrorhamnose 3,5-epimerase [Eubacteriaceae bacterium ES2]|nr:dTDP-4-dehydrorhamnose 3,5-epimerase [Eubacteriaceae bacterium ES2]
MGKFEVEKCPIEGLYIIKPTSFSDIWNYDIETYNEKVMEENGLKMVFVQDNQSMSLKGVLRGLHVQVKYPQVKLVRAIKGSVFDVAVDLRNGSNTFGKWYGIELSEKNKKQFYISEGFAHGFLTLTESAELCYKVSEFWHPNDELGIPWDDPDINIDWPIKKGQIPFLAEKDKNYAKLATHRELW